LDDDTRPRDTEEESRVDLPPRSPARIRFLLTVETPQETQNRIINDKMRYFGQRGQTPFERQ